jgi:YVTN family beta-propeller protein
VALGGSPSAMTIDPDGSRVYATVPAGLLVLDVSTPSNPAVMGVVPTGNNPAAVIVTEDGSQLYVVNEQSHTVSVLATGPGLPVVTRTITAGHKPNRIAVSQTKFYVSSGYAKQIMVFERASGQFIGTIPLDSLPVHLVGGFLPTAP